MKKSIFLFSVFLSTMAFAMIQAVDYPYVIITSSNDAENNELIVYDSAGKFLQAIATKGKGGVVADTTGGGIAKTANRIAVVNFGSQTVSLFKQLGNSFVLSQVIPSLSKPVSVAFGLDHLYILGTNTIESHKMNAQGVDVKPDGSSSLLVGDGSGAQVGILTNQLIISERSNTIELVDLKEGAVTDKIVPVQLPPPPKNKVPVGLVTRGNVAYVTIAHSDEVGIVRNGKLMGLVTLETEHAPCWLALTGPWLFSSNTPSHSISRYKVTDETLQLVQPIAAKVKGLPSDMDAEEGLLAVLDTGEGSGHVNQFQIDNNGNLKLINSSNTAKTANGIAIIKLLSR